MVALDTNGVPEDPRRLADELRGYEYPAWRPKRVTTTGQLLPGDEFDFKMTSTVTRRCVILDVNTGNDVDDPVMIRYTWKNRHNPRFETTVWSQTLVIEPNMWFEIYERTE